MTLADTMDRTRIGTGKRLARLGLALLIGTGVSGCGRSFYEVFEGTQRYSGPDSVIATAEDYGEDDTGLVDGQAAIAYDPDGWDKATADQVQYAMDQVWTALNHEDVVTRVERYSRVT